MNKQQPLTMKLFKSLLMILIGTAFSALVTAQGSATKPLLVGVNPFYKPMVFKEEGKLTGIEPATALEVGKLLSRDIQFVELDWEALIPALQQGDIDVIMSGMSITKERQETISFSRPYLEIGQMAIIRINNAGSLSYPGALYKEGRKVGVEPDTTGEAYAQEFLTTATIKPYNTPQQAFAGLRSGDIDYYIHDAPTSWKLAQSQENSDLLPLYRQLSTESLAWAVKKGNNALLNDLNQALATLTNNGTINLLQNRWIPVKVEVSN